MRIVGGENRGKLLNTPLNYDIRPTSDRARESLFNILLHNDFCGSGALGLEALSRGAAYATFVDIAKESIALTKSNIALVRRENKSKTILSDALILPNNDGVYDIVFMDPPYNQNMITPTIKSLAEKKLIDAHTLLVIETEKSETPPNNVQILKQKVYGKAALYFAKMEK